nr:MAG TPA: hypothetical protein [Caudoviricetes sp.]
MIIYYIILSYCFQKKESDRENSLSLSVSKNKHYFL